VLAIVDAFFTAQLAAGADSEAENEAEETEAFPAEMLICD